MGLTRRGALLFVALFLSALVVPRAGWCGPFGSASDISMFAEPCFTSTPQGAGVVPIRVVVSNHDKQAISAELELESEGGVINRTYTRTIDVPAGADTTYFAYPGVSMYYPATAWIATLRSDKGTLRTRVAPPLTDWRANPTAICLIGDAVGAISGDYLGKSAQAYDDTYLRACGAPDRAVGYSGVNCVMLGRGSEKLDAAQWAALREYVISGGSLVFLGNATILKPNAVRDALLPVRAPFSESTASKSPIAVQQLAICVNQSHNISGVNQSNAYIPAYELLPVFTGTLVPGAQCLDDSAITARHTDGVQFARRTLGIGTVLYSAYDFTREHNAGLDVPTAVWQSLAQYAAPYDSHHSVATAVASRTPWQNSNEWLQAGVQDPFTISVPPLSKVVYVFLAYFVLVVPVSFVVLKRMRRMNLAWITAPSFALLFAGVFYLFTLPLYRAPQTHRTAGFLIAAAGDKTARFEGHTEVFYPRADRYDVVVPGADSIEMSSITGEIPGGVRSATDAYASLETEQDESGMRAIGVGVANLAFRRYYHQETADFGNGLTARLALGSGDTHPLTGTVQNSTGLPLANVRIRICATDAAGEKKIYQYALGNLPTGATVLRSAGIEGHELQTDAGQTMPICPILVADVSGERFGPTMPGSYAGGNGSVILMVSLPAAAAR